MALKSLDHYNIETVELAATVSFYRDVLDRNVGNRPPLDVKGAWMCVGGHPVVHINEVSESRAARTGAMDHVAFEADDFEGMSERLDALGLAYEAVDSRPQLPLRQIYISDPNQIRLELNFRGP